MVSRVNIFERISHVYTPGTQHHVNQAQESTSRTFQLAHSDGPLVTFSDLLHIGLDIRFCVGV